jgi:hypothetical protein
MSTHDNVPRTARDRMREARTRYDETDSSTKWVGFTIGLALLAFIAYMLLAMPSQDPTGGKTVSPAETPQTTTTVPQSPTPSPTAPTTQPK